MNLSAFDHIMAFEISMRYILVPRFAFEQVACSGFAKDKLEVLRVIRLDA